MSPAYTLRNICCRRSGQTVLDIPELDIQSGQVTVLLGPNGAGKSTLLRLLALLDQADSGELIYQGKPVDASDPFKTGRQIGLVLQNPYLLRGTVLDNVESGLKLRGCPARERRIKANQALLEMGIDSLALRPAHKLSGGEAQRVAMARLLVLEPEVLLLDEPFTFLDQTGAALIEKYIRGFTQQAKRTLLFSTHDRLHGMALADEVISLVNGKQIKSPLINVFKGQVDDGYFHTQTLSIQLPTDIKVGSHASIAPTDIVLSCQALTSSMRNSFSGRVVGIVEQEERICVTILAGERIQALITRESLAALQLGLGKQIQVNFKSTAVEVF